MSERPLIISLLIGLIVVLVIGGVSLLVRMNSLDNIYKKEISKNMSLQEDVESLQEENASLKEEKAGFKKDSAQFKTKVDELTKEAASLELLKDKLEENLKEALSAAEVKEERESR